MKINGVEHEVLTPSGSFDVVSDINGIRWDFHMKRLEPCGIPGHEDCGHPRFVDDYAYSLQEAIDKGWLRAADGNTQP